MNYSNYKWLSIGIILGLSSPALATGSDLVLPPTAKVQGKSQIEWSQSWWEWASSFPSSTSPITDRSGERCSAGQSGPVWFLAGAFGSALVKRHCNVPKGKYLFFPLVNYVVFPNREMSLTCEEAKETAQNMTDSPMVLVAEIDGTKIPDLVRHRQATIGCFDLAAKAEMKVTIFPAAANGYYLMLSPLKSGRHSLRFGGELPTLLQAISYELTVD